MVKLMNLKERIGNIHSHNNVLWALSAKNLKAKYSGSILGIWLAIIIPFSLMGAITFVFTKIIHIDIDKFPLFCLSGILPWFFFSASLSEAASSFIADARLLKQFTFPLEFIPIASVLANFMNFVFGLLFIIPIFIIFNLKVLPVLILLPVVLILHLAFTTGLALLLSCLNIFFRDTAYLLNTILMFWFWITPIFYSIEMVPGDYRWVFILNPMAAFISAYHGILFEASFPDPSIIFNAFIISALTLFLGWVIFLKCEIIITKRA